MVSGRGCGGVLCNAAAYYFRPLGGNTFAFAVLSIYVHGAFGVSEGGAVVAGVFEQQRLCYKRARKKGGFAPEYIRGYVHRFVGILCCFRRKRFAFSAAKFERRKFFYLLTENGRKRACGRL